MCKITQKNEEKFAGIEPVPQHQNYQCSNVKNAPMLEKDITSIGASGKITFNLVPHQNKGQHFSASH